MKIVFGKKGNMMKKFIFLLPALSLLTACVAPVVDNNGQAVPIVVQTSPAIIIDGRTAQKTNSNTPVYACQMRVFMDTFKSENTNRGQAVLDTQKQCLAKNNAMFCEVKDIQCAEYK